MAEHLLIEVIVTTAVITTGIGLVGKMAFNWLKNGRGATESKKCSEHENMIKRMNGCEKSTKDTNIELASLRSLFDERTNNIQRELERGTKRFDAQEKKIDHISTSVTQLIAFAEKENSP